uniref:NADH-ubiquinone oxidoreductase chain 4L n=1 Tax=Hydaropsis longirostris TaxID=498947 RepID=B7SMD6_HYDLO|nr:NADH dehydrogenase subunit 4L [Hydaropsis longirostris]ABZ02033.1 NADH dehydrogenase subunit 4L [Hydaropsis longirostris]UPL65646.1 NADH dehydrogenase subunit 4L [Hydarella orientalis]
MNLMLIVVNFMFFSGVVVFSSTRKHLLLTLFSLEFLVLVLFLLMNLVMIIFGFEMFFLLLFLIFTVCEGALGLGILVNMIRNHGNDLLSSLSVLSW